jgi:hypothetical protein
MKTNYLQTVRVGYVRRTKTMIPISLSLRLG